MLKTAFLTAVSAASLLLAQPAAHAEAGPPIVTVEDCGKTAIFVCATSGQRIGWRPQRMRARRHVYPNSDEPTRDLQRLWNDP